MTIAPPSPRREQSLRLALERRAFVTPLSPSECAARFEALTWIEQGEQTAIPWPLPDGKRVYGWVSEQGCMLSLPRRHERTSLDLAWAGWDERDGTTWIRLDLVSLKAARALMLLPLVVALVAIVMFSLLAGRLLLDLLAAALLLGVAGAVVAAAWTVDERRSRDAHARLLTLFQETLGASEVPRSSVPADFAPLPSPPIPPEPPAPVPWRR